jgi:para-nitrobenzyl esterase
MLLPGEEAIMTTVSTPLGELKGTSQDGCEQYLGIRYAKAPVGELRFAPPVPVEGWEGIYDATSFGASAPQIQLVEGSAGLFGTQQTDEDCLFLNVFTPKADDGRRPVMVWIHGGAYTIGSGEMYDGSVLVRRGGVVVVTLNYRLGVLGWMAVDHLDPALAGSGNNGLRDQITALRWVRDNISSFGGDPDNVTIFGESAGGGSISAIIAAPEADGLYHKAIIQSGAPGFGPPFRAEEYTRDLLAALGHPDGGVEALRAVTAEKLVDAQTAVGNLDKMGRDPDHPVSGSGAGSRPVIDGVVVTRSPAEAIIEKAGHNVPMIIGTNEDEGTFFSMFLPTDLTDEELASSMSRQVRDPEAVVAAYRARGTGHTLIADVMTDTVFRIPSLHVADAAAQVGSPVWVYLFTWKTPVFGGLLGATHALELPFVWGQLDHPRWALLVGDAPPPELATAMQDAWLAFARTGNPNVDALPAWPTYGTDKRSTLELSDEISVVDDPGSELRELWHSQTEIAVRA